MEQQEFPALVIRRVLCGGCEKTFKKLKEKIPEIRSIEFNKAQDKVIIFGAVDPAQVKKKLQEKGIIPDILWEESSPIYQQKQLQIVLRKPSVPKIHNRVGVEPHDPADPAKVVEKPKEKRVTPKILLEESSPTYQQKQLQIVQPEPSVSKILKPVRVVPRDPAESAGTKKTENHYLKHEHKLKLVKGSNKRFPCDGCKEDGFGSRYRCERCNFDLHSECRLPKRTFSPGIHKGLIFEFRPQKPPTEKICDACGRDIDGCFYQCEAERMGLHPCCAKLKAQVSNHGMVLVLRKNASSKCLSCREKKPPGTKRGSRGWCYVSKCKKFNIHIHCMTQMLHRAWRKGLTDHTEENSIGKVDLQLAAVSDGNSGQSVTKAALDILAEILGAVVGVLVGDPTALFFSLAVKFFKKWLQKKRFLLYF